MEIPTLKRIIELQQLLQKFNEVDRVVHRKHHGEYRAENDTEHSYNLAMTAWFLGSYFPALNPDLLVRYGLVHDLVEVHAGDTYIYGQADDIASKHDREDAAAKKLAREWSDFPDIHELITAYEKRSSAEARFIYALDKIMPILQIYIHSGYSWRKEGVTLAMLIDNKLNKVALSPEIKPYFDELVQLLEASPHLIKAS